VCLLLQDLVQRCLHGGGGDMARSWLISKDRGAIETRQGSRPPADDDAVGGQ
jgi:uncharacterized protein YidB (DUF937 family)